MRSWIVIDLVVIAGFKLGRSGPLATGVVNNLTSQMKHQIDKDRCTCHAALQSIRMVHNCCGFWYTDHAANEGKKCMMVYPVQENGRRPAIDATSFQEQSDLKANLLSLQIIRSTGMI